MRTLILALPFIGFCGHTNAAEIHAESLSHTHVQAALNLAQAGDTVILPPGTGNWTSTVSRTMPANVTLIGAGTTATGGGDQTIIIDDISGGGALISLNIAATGTFRMSGITFQGGTGVNNKDGGTVNFEGPGNLLIDHCKFSFPSPRNYKVLRLGNGIRGVLAESILNLWTTNAIYAYNGRSGGGEQQGNYEWTQPTAFGSSDFFFIEDCVVNGAAYGTTYDTRLWDGFTAAKIVARFNTVLQACLSETHDTGHAGDDRGTRAQEIYGNSVTSTLAKDPNFTMVSIGGGGALVWGNSANNVYKNMFRFNVTRRHGISDGGTYNQAATPAGWGYAGTTFNGTGSNWDGGTLNGTFPLTGYPAIDQPGRGAGDLLTGLFPSKVNSTTGTIAWPNQVLEPLYIWKNSGNIVSGWGGSYISNNAGSRVTINRDYYAQASGTHAVNTSPTSPFDGSSGIGWGTLANRPTTCTTGVAYWATDGGDWNQSASNPYGVQQNGADGVLYVATATNTWTEYYEPYTYPHPLREVAAPEPSVKNPGRRPSPGRVMRR